MLLVVTIVTISFHALSHEHMEMYLNPSFVDLWIKSTIISLNNISLKYIKRSFLKLNSSNPVCIVCMVIHVFFFIR